MKTDGIDQSITMNIKINDKPCLLSCKKIDENGIIVSVKNLQTNKIIEEINITSQDINKSDSRGLDLLKIALEKIRIRDLIFGGNK